MPYEATEEERRTARKVPPAGRSAMRPGADTDERGDPLPDLPSLMEAERRIFQIEQRSGEHVEDLARIGDAAARARCEWEEHRDRVYLVINDAGEWKSEALSQARAKATHSVAGVPGEELYRSHRILQAALSSAESHQESLRSRLSALQTLVRGLRQVTGFDQ